jgi:alpha-beta hydrolase superfamily lysophospholipase
VIGAIMQSLCFVSFDGTKLYVKHWTSLQNESRGLIMVAHGLGETADYYNEFSEEAIKHGFDVVIPDARGHGRTAGDIDSPDYLSKGGNPGADSLNNMAEDLLALSQFMQKDYVTRPVFLIGHSMGSVVAQLYVMKHGKQLVGLILAGLLSLENAPDLLNIVNDEIITNGLKSPCKKAFQEMFSKMNAPFEPVKTDLDWLTSNEDMSSESLALPTTYVLFNNEFYRDFLLAFFEINENKNWKNIKRTISILLLGGRMDVAGNFGESIRNKYNMLKSIGFKDVNYQIYDGLRHSILRETKRKKVIKDILEWLELQINKRFNP